MPRPQQIDFGFDVARLPPPRHRRRRAADSVSPRRLRPLAYVAAWAAACGRRSCDGVSIEGPSLVRLLKSGHRGRSSAAMTRATRRSRGLPTRAAASSRARRLLAPRSRRAAARQVRCLPRGPACSCWPPSNADWTKHGRDRHDGGAMIIVVNGRTVGVWKTPGSTVWRSPRPYAAKKASWSRRRPATAAPCGSTVMSRSTWAPSAVSPKDGCSGDCRKLSPRPPALATLEGEYQARNSGRRSLGRLADHTATARFELIFPTGLAMLATPDPLFAMAHAGVERLAGIIRPHQDRMIPSGSLATGDLEAHRRGPAPAKPASTASPCHATGGAPRLQSRELQPSALRSVNGGDLRTHPADHLHARPARPRAARGDGGRW